MNGIYLNDAMLPLLELAYLGMPTQKQKLVDAEIATCVSRDQAIFNEIANPRIKMYADKGVTIRDQEINKALRVLASLGYNQ